MKNQRSYIAIVIVLVLLFGSTYFGFKISQKIQIGKLQESDAIEESADSPYVKISVNNTLYKNSDKFQLIFDRYIGTNPDITSGTVTVIWKIDPVGNVGSVIMTENDFDSDYIQEAMIGEIRKIKFPPPPSNKTTLVLHKFEFP